MRSLIVLFVSLIWTSMALAADVAHFESLGFSSDGNYYAFVQDGVQDGSGAYYIWIDVVEVETNKLAKRVRLGGENEFFEDFMANDGEGNDAAYAEYENLVRSTAYEQANLAQFGIVSGQTAGEVLVDRQDTDLSAYTDTVFSLSAVAPGMGFSPTYEVLLAELSAPEEEHNGGGRCGFGNSMIKLEIQEVNGEQNPAVVLQEDTRQPKSRSCSHRYSVSKVIVNGDSIVVILSYMTPGFEGQNISHMAVSGQLP